MKQRDLLTVLIPLFILTLLWVTFTIYHNLSTSTIQDPLTIQIIPIPGSFDLKTLDSLKNRKKVEPQYGASAILDISPSPAEDIQPTGNETPLATDSGTTSPQVNQENL